MKEVLHFSNLDHLRAFTGPSERHVRKLRQIFGVSIVSRGDVVTLEGDDIAVLKVLQVVKSMLTQINNGGELGPEEVEVYIASVLSDDTDSDPDAMPVFLRGKRISPRTQGQKRLVRAFRTNTITFAIGPAGTGKTYLAVAHGVMLLRKGQVRRIVLVRPAVEAGEKLGFLPGDLKEKVDPYLRPLYDSLGDMIESDHLRRLTDTDVIEVAPLAFMRGRTLNRSFVILDEAQNCTVSQMKMFLTRLGNESKAAITGDITQSDLPQGEVSGLVHANHILRDIPGIAFVVLGHADIVRHPLVQKIVDAYERADLKTVTNGGGSHGKLTEESGEVKA